MKNELEARVPPFRQTSERIGLDEHVAYEEKMQAAVDIIRNKKRGKSKRQARAHAEAGVGCCLKRIQCYFGLQPDEYVNPVAPVAVTDWSQKDVDEQVDYGPFDAKKPASFKVWHEPIFITIDIESNEECHSQVTEVGVSILDTRDLVGLAPGENGVDWAACIRSRHLRVREFGHVKNSKFISGCPDRFEFGESEWVALSDLLRSVETCFEPPYSGQQVEADSEDGEQGGIPVVRRNLILVGHGIKTDIQYMRDLGTTIFNDTAAAPKILETIDTAELFRIWKRETQPRSLGAVLAEFGRPAWNLHNAGNDARYTMEVLVRIALGAREEMKQPVLPEITETESTANVKEIDQSYVKPPTGVYIRHEDYEEEVDWL